MTGAGPEIIAVFGGTFDPPHEGHSKCLEAVFSMLAPELIIVVPAYVPPTSKSHVKSTHASYEQRLDMARLHFASQSYGNLVEVSDIESQLSTPSYSLKTMRAIQLKYPNEKLFFVIGFDQLDRLESWYGINDFLNEFNLLVVNRDTGKIESRLEELALNLNRKYHHSSQGILWEGTGTRVCISREDVSPLSSTQIRRENDIVSHWGLCDAVRDYMTKNKLYS